MESGDGVSTGKLLESIETRLGSLKQHPDGAIFRVPRNLRQVDPSEYEPMFVSIGPFHYTPALDRHHELVVIDIDVKERPKLQQGQDLKWHFLQDFLRRNDKVSLTDYVSSIQKLELEARKSYLEDVTALDSDEFNQVMLLDGCFILEHFLKKTRCENSVRNFYSQHGNNIIITNVSIDLLLLENQLPLVVLEKIYNLFKGQDQDSTFPMSSLGELAVKSFEDLTLIQFGKVISFRSDGDELSSTYHHLLHLLHDQLFRPPSHHNSDNASCTPDPDVVRSATTLREMGVKFKQPTKEDSNSLFEINFKKGILQLPHLQIYDQTGKLFRNMVAFEQSSTSVAAYVSPYVLFMDELIDTTRDVDTLEKHGVLTSNMGDNESVANLFNQIGLGCKSITCYRTNYLQETKSLLTKYCKDRTHRWRAKLLHDYFSSPWSILSLVGAIVLLLLTALQTIFTIRSR